MFGKSGNYVPLWNMEDIHFYNAIIVSSATPTNDRLSSMCQSRHTLTPL